MKINITKLLLLVAFVLVTLFKAAHASEYYINSVSIESDNSILLGSVFTVRTTVDTNHPGVSATINVPQGLEVIDSKTHILGENKETVWNVIARNTGLYSITVSATDGTNYKSTSKLINVNFNSLDLTVYQSKLNPNVDETFVISGTVKDYRGNSVPNTTIEIAIDGKRFTTKTNSEGGYSANIDIDRAGSFVMTVTAKKDYLSRSTQRMVQTASSQSGGSGGSNSGSGNSGSTSGRNSLKVKVFDADGNRITADSICVNGRCVSGKQEHTFRLQESTATVEVKKSTFDVHTANINVNRNTEYQARLQKTFTNGYAEVVVKSYDTNEFVKARVTFTNGQSYNVDRTTRVLLIPGLHGMTVEANGYLTETRNVHIHSAGTTYAIFSLKRNPAANNHTNDGASKGIDKDYTMENIGIAVLWISAIVSVIALAASVYWIYFKDPREIVEGF